MGVWTTVKTWLNIGGVDIKLWKFTEPLQKSAPVISGAVLLKTKSDRTIQSVEVKVIEELTKKKEDDEGEKKSVTETTVLGRWKVPEHEPGIGYPLELKGGESKEQPFELTVAVTERLQRHSPAKGGVMGGLGKLASMVLDEKVEYFIVATASVKGTALSPTDKQKLTISD